MGESCPTHRFDVPYSEAREIQAELGKQVVLADVPVSNDRIVGGADVAFAPFSPNLFSRFPEIFNDNSPVFTAKNRKVFAIAAAVVMDRATGSVLETASAVAPVYIPYVPGFLSFRECPSLLKALGALEKLPSVMFYDGCGIAHPRGLGLASHIGVLTGIPSIGCAKSRLCGDCAEPGNNRGDWSDIIYQGKVVGACLRTQAGKKPLYVSPGTGFTIESSVDFVLSMASRYRLPEPTRLAHIAVTAEKKKFGGIEKVI